jgi:hypothetical protein
MIIGLLLVPALIAALWLNANNLLMGFSAWGVHHGLNLLMIALEVALLETGARRSYSLDGLLWAKRSNALALPVSRAVPQ